MKVSCTCAEVMIIEFTKDELEACRLTYEKLTSSASESKEAICRIITEAQKISGESIKISNKTKVDILPDGEGGCLIILNSKKVASKEEKLQIYESNSLDNILDFAKHTGKMKNIKSSLFKKSDTYRLILEAEKSVHLKCSEFLQRVGSGDADSQMTNKNFDCIIAENALKILGGFTA